MLSDFDVIQSHIKKFKDTLYTAMPAKIKTVNLDGDSVRSIDVIPTIARYYPDNDIRRRPTLYDVPVIWPSGGGGIISFPLNVGDTILLLFCKDDIDNFKNAGSEIPNTLRKFSYNDAVAIPCFFDFNSNLQPSSEDVEIKFKDNNIILKKDGTVEVVTKSTISIKNDQEELISLLSDILQTLEDTTVNTIYGLSPLNSKTQIASLKQRLDTFKK